MNTTNLAENTGLNKNIKIRSGLVIFRLNKLVRVVNRMYKLDKLVKKAKNKNKVNKINKYNKINNKIYLLIYLEYKINKIRILNNNSNK